MGDHCRGRRRKHRKREREDVSARVHNEFEIENNDDHGEVENFQQAGNALALKRSNNNRIEQENEQKNEED